ncbi:MAG TPA: hypothetical protein VK450_00560 [Methanomicrobiales archaeon]|nr:hypothetical protein [Methanomicrobiales archaeon]
MNNPFSVDNYVHGYLDRRMKYLIEEWNLARKGDLGDFPGRLEALDREIEPMKVFEKTADARIEALEDRFRKIKGAKK